MTIKITPIPQVWINIPFMLSCECRTFRCHQAMRPSVCECVFGPETKRRTSQKVVHEAFEEDWISQKWKTDIPNFYNVCSTEHIFHEIGCARGECRDSLGQDTSRMGCMQYFQHIIWPPQGYRFFPHILHNIYEPRWYYVHFSLILRREQHKGYFYYERK